MAVETRILHCINCPMGCEITAEIKDGIIKKIAGNHCQRGEVYTKEEITAPKRMLTSTVRIQNGVLPLLPVVSVHALPKEKVMECAQFLRQVTVKAPVRAGDIVAANILGLGIDIAASRDMDSRHSKDA